MAFVMAGSLSSPNRWLSLEQSSNVVRTVVASAPMSPSGTTSSHAVRGVVSGGRVCAFTGPLFRTSSSLVACVPCTQLPCTVGYCARPGVRAWASCLYRVQCWWPGLGGGVAAGSGVGCSFSIVLCPCRVACTRVYSSSSRSGVNSRWASPVDALVVWHVAVRA